MQNFSKGLLDSIDRVEQILNTVASNYGGIVTRDFPARSVETPISRLLISIGIDKMNCDILSFGNNKNEDVLNGDVVDVVYCIAYHSPMNCDGSFLQEVFMKVADKFCESKSTNCIKIESRAISYNRSERTIVLKSYFTIRFVI